MIVKTFEDVEKRVDSAEPGSVFLISGDEYCQSSILLDRLRTRTKALGYETVHISPGDLPELSLLSLFSEGSLFSSGKLIIISSVDKIPNSSRNDLIQVLEKGTENILFARTEGRKPSNKFIRALESHGVSFTCWEPFPSRMWLWTRRFAEEEGITFTKDGSAAAEEIASGKLERLADVVTRVALFHGKGVRASSAGVYKAVKGDQETTAFEFCKAALSGDRSGAMTSLAILLRSGEEPVRLLALLYSQWYQVASASEMLKNGNSGPATAKKLGITQFRWKSVERLAYTWRSHANALVLDTFASADYQLKRGGDPLVSIGSVVVALTKDK
ncbi:hypothetical protein CSA37_11835 [Candidatus Fermentibacteria bacterium]|nr:MAG: hypothetical protein CSA37_11835 [Candidatus Fermentibacteria bacterium]